MTLPVNVKSWEYAVRNECSLSMLQFDNVGTYLNFLTGSEHQPGGHVRCRRSQIPVALPLCHEWEVVWRHRGAFSRHASEGASSLTQGHIS